MVDKKLRLRCNSNAMRSVAKHTIIFWSSFSILRPSYHTTFVDSSATYTNSLLLLSHFARRPHRSGNDADAENIKRFGGEIDILARLNHPNIVPLLFAVVEPPKLCLGLEFGRFELTKALKDGILVSHDDHNLGLSWQNNGKPLQLAQMCVDLAAGLVYCHRLGIAHRDIKTDNCLIMEDNRCCLADFGEAKKLTDTNTVVGTPWYMAPEVFRGDEYGVKSDVYSFGILLGVCLYHGSVSDFFWWDKARKRSGFVATQYILRGWRPKFKSVFEESLPSITALIETLWVDNANERPSMEEVHKTLANWAGDVDKRASKKEEGIAKATVATKM